MWTARDNQETKTHQESSSSDSDEAIASMDTGFKNLEEVELAPPLSRMTSKKRLQIKNYINGTALILNIHPTHHAGTTFCGTIGRNGGLSPGFVCMGDSHHVVQEPSCMQKDFKTRQRDEPPFCYSYQEIKKWFTPWRKVETGPFIEFIRPYFHMISWEFGGINNVKKKGHGRTLNDPDWDHPNLLSVIITRDSLSRLLAGDGTINKKFPGYSTKALSHEKWWDYALYKDLENTDNFFLRILSGDKRSSFNKTQRLIPNHIEAGIERTTEELMELFPTNLDEKNFEHAKAVLDKFTVVLDIACLTEGMEALAHMLHIGPLLTKQDKKEKQRQEEQQRRILKLHEAPKERIQYEDVYQYLLAKNHWDMALYEYSKTISLVNCENIKANTNHTRF